MKLRLKIAILKGKILNVFLDIIEDFEIFINAKTRTQQINAT